MASSVGRLPGQRRRRRGVRLKLVGLLLALDLPLEEILADNFALLFILSGAETPKQVPSPELLQRMKRVMGISARNQSFLSADQKIAVA